ncbi:hypothetical protein [uncultured Hyphomicrobium sp.]|uniref:hypothetical protein n=1 Tax=uncultured Hyphomicrobium sp. TaxID=194373 RepID=UPI0025FE534D|nr:hypothetical protein [uncultured Hyphomicrobium sp.]
MTFTKTAALAAAVAVAALGTGMTAANAHGKKLNHHHFGHHHHGLIVIGSSDYGCKHWLRKYKKTGNEYFLDRYYLCKY